jgi:hypothetical protein
MSTYKAVLHSVKEPEARQKDSKAYISSGEACRPSANACLFPPHLLTVKMLLNRAKDGWLHA